MWTYFEKCWQNYLIHFMCCADITGAIVHQFLESIDNPWSIEFTVPVDAEIGTYPITVDGEECSFPSGSLTVKAATTTKSRSPLANSLA